MLGMYSTQICILHLDELGKPRQTHGEPGQHQLEFCIPQAPVEAPLSLPGGKPSWVSVALWTFEIYRSQATLCVRSVSSFVCFYLHLLFWVEAGKDWGMVLIPISHPFCGVFTPIFLSVHGW